MQIKELKPAKALNKAFLKVKPNRTDIERFKANLILLLDTTNDSESEEFHKNVVSDFLKKTYYDPNYFINTKGRNDLVIHNGNKASSTVGVIIEAKSPANKSEMITAAKLNVKAFQELVLYYLRERITHKNLEVKHLVITNIHEWFIFDAVLFDRLFAQNKNLVKQFNDFESGRLADIKTDFFYKQIAEPFIAGIQQEVEFAYFDIRNYQKTLRNKDKEDDRKLITLFKLLSPEHLLKLPFVNDSNSLDKRFYAELLHIIGLSETKEGSKKLIGRKNEGERNSGAILEDTIIQLDSLDKLSRLNNPSHFGDTKEERLFTVALELCITWINRVLFLKLLEAQLINYHKGDRLYSFLNGNKIKSYDDLNSLFFQVLARRFDERNDDVKSTFEKVPYLNSSLFEPTDIEQVTLFISNLRDDKTIPVISSTVLKDEHGRKVTGNLTTLDYLFRFLDAYDFSGEGGEDIQEDNKTLINASVLGLIFEKINGYKDGSYFTPGFITMYMCRETIRKAVVDKFREYCLNGDLLDVKISKIGDLHDLIPKHISRKKANEIVNSLKICDPAVGSGHFLVSALNEIIAIKNDLKILQDKEGRSLHWYELIVENDELVITDQDGELFQYHPGNKESQRVQETLFHEKETIIENCLFGVDINPNSVKICRLRLWIELLKNAYYNSSSALERPGGEAFTTLETLPNIDINIKCGNSLVSRFEIDADLKQALKKSKWTIDSYKVAVATYQNAESKEEKREMEKLIADIKNDFVSELSFRNKEAKDVVKYRGLVVKIASDINNRMAFGEKVSPKLYKALEKATMNRDKAESKIKEIENNKIFENAFEWRFEFPEVLNDEGKFVGFDVIIGNPPYIRVQDLQHILIDYYKSNFVVAHKRIDISILFIELANTLLSLNGILSYITSNQFLKAEYGRNIRAFLKGYLKVNVDYSKVSVFDGLATYVSVFLITKTPIHSVDYVLMENAEQIPKSFSNFDVALLSDEPWEFNTNQTLKSKVFSDKKLLNEIANFTYGVITGLDKAFLIPVEIIKKQHLEAEITKRFIRPQNYKRYKISNQTYGLIYPYNSDNSIIAENELKTKYPNCYSFLLQFKEELENRKDSRTTIKEKGLDWYSIMRRVDLSEIDAEKIIFYDVGMLPNFMIDTESFIFGGGTSHSLKVIDTSFNINYILGVLNSKLIAWLIHDMCPVKMGNARKYGLDYIKKLPIIKADSKIQFKIHELVNEVINAKKDNSDSIEFENQIDQLVYQLYDLTEEEMAIVENDSK
jgi:type II restriction/modification system DNA methylase subunit YeeA